VDGSDPDLFKTFSRIVLALDGPMFIVTATTPDERSGCLIGFGVPCSVDPQRFLACISKANHTHGVALRAAHLAVHVVPAGGEELAELFGGETGDDVDKFARVGWQPGPGGVPLLDACPNRFVGTVRERLDGGDHVAFVLEPVAADHSGPEREFTFHRAKRIEPGHPA
jgi:flavin reductase (DIM6/NTAB) family NADH-FMN oxidoreductase RutF